MKTIHIGLLVMFSLVVIVGCIVLYLFIKNKKPNSNKDPNTPVTTTPDTQSKKPNSPSPYDELPSTSKSSNYRNYNDDNDDDPYKAESLTISQMNDAQFLTKLVKVSKDNSNNFLRLNTHASKLIFSVYGNIIPDYNNEVRLFNNDGICLVKLKLLPKLNKVVINDWIESENIFKQNTQWPKNIIFSITDNIIRMNNVIVYEFNTNEIRNYRFININLKGVSEIQLLSLNNDKISAEEIIKK